MKKGCKRIAKCHFNSIYISFELWISRVKENQYLFYCLRPLWSQHTAAGKSLSFSPKASNFFSSSSCVFKAFSFALRLVELHAVHEGPPLKPVKVPLNGIPSLQCVNHTTQLGVIGKLAEGALSPTVHVTDMSASVSFTNKLFACSTSEFLPNIMFFWFLTCFNFCRAEPWLLCACSSRSCGGK